MSLSSSCYLLVVNKPHPHSCCGVSLQRQCLYFIIAVISLPFNIIVMIHMLVCAFCPLASEEKN